VSASDFFDVFSAEDVPALEAVAQKSDDDLIRVYRDRLITLLKDAGESEGTFAINYLSHLTRPPGLEIAVKDDQIVWARSPVRLDLGGGWTDTPPYTLREGGAVTNVAVDLNGQSPIQVFCRPVSEPVVRVHSIDLGLTETYTSFGELESYGDPDASFALPKAALVLLGFSREVRGDGARLSDVLGALGGGIELTLLSAIPKGSGLGTSSIIGATILAALERFCGIFDEAYLHSGELYRQVLQMEQMLTTGGGWQDQIGGAAGGVKFIESAPGLRPDPRVYQLDPFLFEDGESVSRMTLFYTGATRLAKNILKEVVDGFNGMTPAYLFTVRRIGALSYAARDALGTRNLDALAGVIEQSWRENRLIHHSTSNEEIESLLSRLRPHYQAVKLLGAGGGGYALFISRTPEAATRLQAGLAEYVTETGNPRARTVDFALNKAGFVVTVS
jgi:galactokinase/mevalonate kinase-like predicted kinase